MRYIFLLLIFISCIMVFFSCKKPNIITEDICIETIQINQIIDVIYGCKYKVEFSDDTTIIFEFIDIYDVRELGFACMASTGGSADVYFKFSHIEKKQDFYLDTYITGCGTETLFQLDHPGLSRFDYGSFSLIFANLLPFSQNLQEYPSSINEYVLKMGVLR